MKGLNTLIKRQRLSGYQKTHLCCLPETFDSKTQIRLRVKAHWLNTVNQLHIKNIKSKSTNKHIL